MSPFAGYSDFAACVSDNGDKASPEGFCAWLEHEVTGSWSTPSNLSMPGEAFAVFTKAYHESKKKGAIDVVAAAHAHAKLEESGWQHTRAQYLKSFEAPKMRTVTGVKVFAVGTWTDSSGFERAWTEQDLLNMASAFNAGVPTVVALKAGHTTDSFNAAIAEALDVPVQLIIGEAGGNGQVSLGKMASLELKGSLLVAAFERVPEAVADLVDGGMFNTVSAEIEEQIGEFGPVITGVALLGAENPAVEDATLDRAMVFGGKREGAKVLTFALGDDIPIDKAQLHEEFGSLKEKMSDAIKGMKGAPIFRAMLAQLDGLYKQITSKNKDHQAVDNANNSYQEGITMDPIQAIAVMLGLGEDAAPEDVVAAIEALVKKVQEAPPAEPMAEELPKEEDERAMAELKEQVRSLTHDKLVNKYSETTRTFRAIEGRPEEIAEELAKIEETHGAESAQTMLHHYQKSNDLSMKAIEVLGTEIRTDNEEVVDHPFEAEAREYSKEKQVTYQVALAHLSQAKPAEFAAYRRATKPQAPAGRQ